MVKQCRTYQTTKKSSADGVGSYKSKYDKAYIARCPSLTKFVLSRDEKKRGLLSQRRLGLAINRPHSLKTVIPSYLSNDDNDLLFTTLTNHAIFERAIATIDQQQKETNTISATETRNSLQKRREYLTNVHEEHEEQTANEEETNENIRPCRCNTNKFCDGNNNNINNNNKNINLATEMENDLNIFNTRKEEKEYNKNNILKKEEIINRCALNMTELLAFANPSFYLHCEMNVEDDVIPLWNKMSSPRWYKKQQTLFGSAELTLELDTEVKKCRLISKIAKDNAEKIRLKVRNYTFSTDTTTKEINAVNEFGALNSKLEIDYRSDYDANTTLTNSHLQSTNLNSSPSSGIVLQSRKMWEKHLQDELLREGETVESFRQSKVQKSYVSKHNFAQKAQWNEYQQELKLSYAQSEAQRRKERRKQLEQQF